jgi:MFS family permease
MMGAVDGFVTPFALALHASPRGIAWLTSVPALFGAAAQWWTGRLTRAWGGRKTVLLRVVGGQAVVLVLLAGLAFSTLPHRVPVLIALMTGYVVFGGLSGPVWNSLMADYLPASHRAGYYGWRNRITGLVLIAGALGAGAWLTFSAGSASPAAAPGALASFGLLFLAAAAARAVSWRFLARFYEPVYSRAALPAGRFDDFWRETRGGPFWPFVACAASMTFAANLSGPYFPVYLIRGLKFSYLTYTTVMMAVQVALSFSMALWGRAADEIGLQKIFRLSCWLTLLMPLLWLVSPSPWYIFFLQLFGGLSWAGFNLSTTNYLFDAVPARWHIQAISYFNVINGTALFAGAFLGGHVMEKLPPLLGFPFLTLLQISGALRLAVCLTLLPKVRPVRRDAAVSNWQVFYSVLGLKPLIGVYRGVVDSLTRVDRG